MKSTYRVSSSLLVSAAVLGMVVMLAACSPKVGSKEWCKQMKAKPSGEWTVNETADYAKHCAFK